jgi:hypothetical protein
VEDNSGRTVSMTFRVLTPGHRWPYFLASDDPIYCGRSIILLKQGISYPGIPHLAENPVSAVRTSARRMIAELMSQISILLMRFL